MRGPKRNEGATAIGQRAGTRAVAKHVHSSAYKARVVLDLIRGLDVRSADEVLQLTDRQIARDIRKVLSSAVHNATDAESGAYIADADELYVIACFADEGPTMRRFKPRARGRATRIRKRTCHITVIVARMSDERIEIVQARAEGAGQAASASRAARVERSRKRAQQAKDELDQADDASVEAASADDGAESTDSETEAPAVQAFADADADADADTDGGGDAAGEFAPGEWTGSVLPDSDGNGPDSHPIKGNADSMLYHVPGSRYYKVTKAEVWFDTEDHAEAAGFSQPGSTTTDDSDSGDEK